MKYRILVLLLALAQIGHLRAQEELNPVADPAAVVTSGNMRFTVLTPQMIRIQYSDKAQFEDRATFAIVNRRLPVPAFTQQTQDGYLYITTDSLSLRYKIGSHPKTSDRSSANLRISFRLNGQDVVWYPGKDDALNLKGTRRTLDGAWGDSFKEGMENGLLSRAGWSIIDESPSTERSDGSHTFALQPNEDGFSWLAQPVDPKATDWYFLGYGHNYRLALGDFVRVAGRIPLPPKYVFGYWYSRYWAYTQSEFQQLVREVERYDIPMDVMIVDTDWHINGWTGWSWNKKLITNPKQLLSYFHLHKLKTSLNLHPAFGVDSNEDNFSLLCSDLGLPSSTSNVPWQLHDYQFYRSMFERIIRLREQEGVDFWWLDWQQWLTSPFVDGLGETFWCNHVFFEDMRRNRPEVRPVIFHRWGGLGSHRYQIGFSGDSYTAWSTLAFEVGFTSTASNVGYTYWGHDLGGHNQSGPNDPELFLRWMQFGVFTPIFRSHATNASHIERRIWKFDNFPLLLDAVRLRYAIFPYLYTAARETYDTGVGMTRPLYYDYPEENNAYKFEDEFLFGNDMLVAPIYTPCKADGTARRSIWLPRGQWWDVSNGELLTGDRIFTGHFTTAQIPLYYKAGAIIPNYPVQRTVQTTPETIILQVVPGADGQGLLYEDNGDNQEYPTAYAQTRFQQERSIVGDVTLNIQPREGSFADMPMQRSWQVVFLGVENCPEDILLDGQPVTPEQYTYDPEGHTLTVNVPLRDCSAPTKIQLRCPAPAMANIPSAIHRLTV